MEKRRAIVVCGPTACGKSRVADEVADRITIERGSWTTTLVVDSMQVYRELPVISNQYRERSAELVGIASVSEEWNVAKHREACYKKLEETRGTFVLDAGTGMYLNAILMDIPLAPKVTEETRQRAYELLPGAPDRREVRKKELEISGAQGRKSIWDGELQFETEVIYIRPQRDKLDASIAERSLRISSRGLDEARRMIELSRSGKPPNSSVMDSIGVRELISSVCGDLDHEEAKRRVEARTRRLARRQMRWFDKLLENIGSSARVSVVESPEEACETAMIY